MAFDDDFTAEAIDDLLAEFGEPVIYHPQGGLPREITAIVNRNPSEPLFGGEGLVVASLLVTVKKHPTAGIETDTVDFGGDLVELPIKAGGTPEKRPLVRPGSDDGANTFWVR